MLQYKRAVQDVYQMCQTLEQVFNEKLDKLPEKVR